MANLLNMKKKTYRLFFALWPSDNVRDSITDEVLAVSRQLTGRNVQPGNLHMTLHFIGQATDDEKACMHAAALSVTAEPFSVELSQLGLFSRAKILWAGPDKLPAELILLHDKLGDALSNCGYECEKRPYRPHVTLKRSCAKHNLEDPLFSIPWTIREFVLVESVPGESGVDYHVLERYPLR